jgi:POT family proton-dependent oligopeptide transporter
MLLTVFFWAVYEQQGNTLALWADVYTDRHILGWEMPASWFQAFNPAMVFVLAPLVTGLWAWQGKREPTSIAKMALGCVLLGASFLIMMLAARAYEDHGKAQMWWLTACIFMLTLGELFLVPVGLSLVVKLAPARIASMLMGMWLLSSFLGSYLTGYLGTFWEKIPKEDFFLMLSLLSLGAGLGMFALQRPLKRVMGGQGGFDGAPMC